MSNIFDHRSYVAYLESICLGPKNRGLKSALAMASNCQPAFLSQVLKRIANLNLDQALAMSNFLKHNELEREYFFQLVLLERSSTENLKSLINAKLKEIRNKAQNLTNLVATKEALSEQAQGIYYSAWEYGAIHMALSLHNLQSATALSNFFGLTEKKVHSVLDFLSQYGLAKKNGLHYERGLGNIHLGTDSALLSSLHTQARLLAMNKAKDKKGADLFFSSFATISKKDAKAIKRELLEKITQVRSRMKNSSDEELIAFNLDFYTFTSENEK